MWCARTTGPNSPTPRSTTSSKVSARRSATVPKFHACGAGPKTTDASFCSWVRRLLLPPLPPPHIFFFWDRHCPLLSTRLTQHHHPGLDCDPKGSAHYHCWQLPEPTTAAGDYVASIRAPSLLCGRRTIQPDGIGQRKTKIDKHIRKRKRKHEKESNDTLRMLAKYATRFKGTITTPRRWIKVECGGGGDVLRSHNGTPLPS
jgi:hypothetical protein